MKWNNPKSQISSHFEILKVPGFDAQKFPFLLMRDDFAICIFNVRTESLYKIKSAPYKIRKGTDGFRTMDLITLTENKD